MATTLGQVELGGIVKFNVDNTPYEWQVVNKDDNGVTLWMKGYYGTREFGVSQDYIDSSIDLYAKLVFYDLIDSSIRSKIINKSIVCNEYGTVERISRKVYLPSMTEIGGTHSYAMPTEGLVWQYFSDTGGGTSANEKRAYIGSSASIAWLRSRYTNDTNYRWGVVTNGRLDYYRYSNRSYDFRPALNLPFSMNVLDDGTLDGTQAPEPLVKKGLGTTVKLKIDGTPYDFTVVDKTDGVTLWMTGYYGSQVFGSKYIYAGSNVDIYANETFLNLLELKDKIINKTIQSNNSAIQRKVYLPSGTEVGNTHSYMPTEGLVWQYFSDTGGGISANEKRAYIGSSASIAWLRTKYNINSDSCWSVKSENGSVNKNTYNHSYDFRPALTLPYNLIVDEDGNVTAEEAKLTFADIPLGSSVKINIDNTPYDFMVVNKDSSDVALWMKGYYGTQKFGSHTYAGSSIDTYANETFYELIDSSIRSKIINKSINSNNSTIQRKAYLPSVTEVGGTHDNALIEGPVWQYFSDIGGTTGGNTKRAYIGGGSAWLRSFMFFPYSSSSACWTVKTDGSLSNYTTSTSCDFRPAFNLPSNGTITSDGYISFNEPPTTPESITVPDVIWGGRPTTVSWSASTDPEGQLEGYELERSTDGGSTWSNRYRGELTSTTGTVPNEAHSVMYRVRAYDTDGAYSDWCVSGSKVVRHNQAPTKPATITLPTTIYGGMSAVISWSASTDPEGNEITYVLSRQEDSGEWEEVYSGENLTYTDSVKKTIDTIRWKVCAVDEFGDKSDDNLTAIRTVLHNNPPVITSDPTDGTDLGEITEKFALTYSVTDEDEDEVTVTERIDNLTLREHVVTLGDEYTFNLTDSDFLKTLNGTHTATISALDKGEPTVSTITFTKALYEATATLETPLEVDEPIIVCAMSVEGYIPEDADYTVLVTNNALDDEPVWEDMTNQIKGGLNHPFTNTTVATTPAFNFKAIVKRGASNEGGYIDSISGAFE